MQILTYVKTKPNGETKLYCDMCDSLFDQDFINNNLDTFQDIHRVIHNKMSLNSPDLEKIDSYPQSY